MIAFGPMGTAEERKELRRLKKENRRRKQEGNILSKAAAWFARDTGSIPDGSLATSFTSYNAKRDLDTNRVLRGCALER